LSRNARDPVSIAKVYFQCSQSREALVNELDRLNYDIEECLLSPTQFGIPNHRLRYYLIARKRAAPGKQTDYLERAVIHERWPFTGETMKFVPPPISTFLDMDEEEAEQHLVPEKYLTKSHNFRFGKRHHPHTSFQGTVCK
jgi:tRNA (cytosine38-C5)-methyltransferase